MVGMFSALLFPLFLRSWVLYDSALQAAPLTESPLGAPAWLGRSWAPVEGGTSADTKCAELAVTALRAPDTGFI